MGSEAGKENVPSREVPTVPTSVLKLFQAADEASAKCKSEREKKYGLEGYDEVTMDELDRELEKISLRKEEEGKRNRERNGERDTLRNMSHFVKTCLLLTTFAVIPLAYFGLP